ncbi:hypothetical protein [Streptomyces badius]
MSSARPEASTDTWGGHNLAPGVARELPGGDSFGGQQPRCRVGR